MENRNPGLPHGAWVLVADGEKALIFVNEGDDEDMNLVVREKEEQENPKASDWAANRPGRFNDGPTAMRSAVEDTDWHELEKERFATDLADMLYRDAHADRFEHLVIVASRPALSALRHELHKEVAQRVLRDVPKVLTNHPVDEIETAVSRAIRDV